MRRASARLTARSASQIAGAASVKTGVARATTPWPLLPRGHGKPIAVSTAARA